MKRKEAALRLALTSVSLALPPPLKVTSLRPSTPISAQRHQRFPRLHVPRPHLQTYTALIRKHSAMSPEEELRGLRTVKRFAKAIFLNLRGPDTTRWVGRWGGGSAGVRCWSFLWVMGQHSPTGRTLQAVSRAEARQRQDEECQHPRTAAKHRYPDTQGRWGLNSRAAPYGPHVHASVCACTSAPVPEY